MQPIPSDTLIPHGSELHDIEDRYGPLKTKIRCGLEGCRTPHNHGFVVSFSNSHSGLVRARGVVGHVCGRNTFGTNWITAESVYDAQVRRNEIEAATERFQARLGRILPELEAARPRLVWQHEIRKVLSQRVLRMMRICYEAASKQGGHIREIRGQGFVSLHQLRGTLFWLDDRALSRAQELEYTAKQLRGYIASAEATSKEIDNRLSRLGDVSHTWDLVCKWMHAADAALSSQHLERVIAVISRIPGPALEFYGLSSVTSETFGLRVTGASLEVYDVYDPRSEKMGWQVISRLDKPSDVGVNFFRKR